MTTIHEVRRRYLINVLVKHMGNKTAAAKEMGVSFNTLKRWMAKYLKEDKNQSC